MRNHLTGSKARPRLNVFRSGQHIYAQVIDDTTGTTLVAASSLDETLRAFKSAQPEEPQEETKEPSLLERVSGAVQSVVEAATDALPVGKTKSAKTQNTGGAKNAPQKGGKAGATAAAKVNLPAAQRNAPKTPVEALAAISNNRKVAISREVGKLVAQRAQEKGVKQVVFDRGGYAYHGRIAALAEGAREAGLDF